MSTLLLLLLGLWVANAAKTAAGADNLDLQFISSDDLKNLLNKHKDAELLTSKAVRQSTFNMGRLSDPQAYYKAYSIGDRVDGDERVVYKTHKHIFEIPQNISIKANYPSASSNAKTATVSLLDIKVKQSSDLGYAYILSGGIGENTISIAIVADNTNLIDYNISIYGYY